MDLKYLKTLPWALAAIFYAKPVTATEAEGRCVCIFDFDDTIRLSGGSVAPEFPSVLASCLSSKYQIAIASASCTVDFQKRYLHDNVNSSVFSWGFLGSPAYQTCEGWKKISLQRVTDFYGTPPPCSMLFDNNGGSKAYADELGVVFFTVSPKRGVSSSDFAEANAALQRQCKCSV
eukprot:jgi/Botrbrau1/19449/Bobra.0338s0070.1